MIYRITQLATSHLSQTPRVGKIYFGALHAKIHEFVIDNLEEPPNSEVVQLWTRLFGIIYDVFVTEEDKLPPEDEHIPGKEADQKGCCCRIV